MKLLAVSKGNSSTFVNMRIPPLGRQPDLAGGLP